MQPLLLYGVPFSQPVRAVMWLMLYKRTPFEMVLINPGSKGETGSRNPAYLAKNPGGTIPTIEEPDTGFVLSEAHAIMCYLSNTHGLGRRVSDGLSAARQDRLVFALSPPQCPRRLRRVGRTEDPQGSEYPGRHSTGRPRDTDEGPPRLGVELAYGIPLFDGRTAHAGRLCRLRGDRAVCSRVLPTSTISRPSPTCDAG